MTFNILFMIASIFIQSAIYYWFLNVSYKNSLVYAFVANLVSYIGIILLSPLTVFVLFPVTQSIGIIGNIIYVTIIYCITVLLQLVAVRAASERPIKKLLLPIVIGNLVAYAAATVFAYLNLF